jgi:hypothetical protein
MCRAVPFFRLGNPHKPGEISFYVFNRVENDTTRWVSYQEAQEQELFDRDEAVLDIINFR